MTGARRRPVLCSPAKVTAHSDDRDRGGNRGGVSSAKRALAHWWWVSRWFSSATSGPVSMMMRRLAGVAWRLAYAP